MPKSSKDVLLIFPPLQNNIYGKKWKPSESPEPPLGLLYVASPIIKAGYYVNFIDLSVEKLEEEQYFNLLKKADFVLISCFTHALENVKKIISDVKGVNDNAFIICGGPFCNETENHVEGSDLTVFGEPDLVIAEILDLVSSHKPLDDIPGLSYIKNGKPIRNPGTLIVEDLDLIGPPALGLAKNKPYGYLYGVKVKAITPMITSRGCPFSCRFCTYRRVKYRERSIDKVIHEIKERIEEGAEYIVFNDDNFLIQRDRVMELMDNIIESGIKIRLGIQGRIDLADYELYRKLKKAGVVLMMFGIETANQDVLDFYNKKTTVEKIRKAIFIANRVGIITYGNMMIGAPIEEKKHFDENKRFLREVPLDFLNVHILHFSYPSLLWKEAHKNGLIGKNEIMVAANEKLCNFTNEELVKIQEDMIKSFYNYPKRILRLMYKLPRNLGVRFILKILKLYYRKGIYRSAEKILNVETKDVRI